MSGDPSAAAHDDPHDDPHDDRRDGPRERGASRPAAEPRDPEARARDICLRLLTGSPRTRAQLADALRRKDVPDDVAERVLSRFTDVGLIDDEAFAQAWVQSRHTGRGLAKRALAAELRRRGVADETVNDAVEVLDPAREEETARALVARRLPATRGVDPAKRMRRLVGMLARKGYPPGLAFRVVKEALADEGAHLDDHLFD
ncbi:recombination regulator RecX [Actinomadura sp. WMMB 499]|uniref:recombination regulator RecX n=1 Tax=Actinomadura sp. WMMB 499 TaxID=1219491 RepID=UPI00124875F0|nr:recombination regulator RecX [Actinomadura sp. WMMB 499]QFG25609.1 recombination regulator RecX [Actinomadura sp. WMMB 499]